MSSAIVVLGSPNDEFGNLLPIALSRGERALFEYNKLSDCKILCTGGFGEHFNTTKTPHGKYLQEYLIGHGIPLSSFLDVALSSYTLEDATLSKPILLSGAIDHIVLVTSDFYMERAKLIFGHVLAGFTFEYAAASTPASKGELERLTAHEKSAIKRELLNLQG